MGRHRRLRLLSALCTAVGLGLGSVPAGAACQLCTDRVPPSAITDPVPIAPGAGYRAPGSLDTTFDGDGKALVNFGTTGASAQAVAVQPDGKIVAAGGDGHNYVVVRLLPGGGLDPAFGTGGKVVLAIGPLASAGAEAMVLQPDGKIVIAGRANFGPEDDEWAVARLLPNGQLDDGFDYDGILIGPFGSGAAESLALQPDGKIVVAGGTRIPATDPIIVGDTEEGALAVARLNADGSRDTTFAAGGTRVTPLGDSPGSDKVLVQPDGRIVLVGWNLEIISGSDLEARGGLAVLRLTATGLDDSTFGPNGLRYQENVPQHAFPNAAVLLPNGTIAIAGTSDSAGFVSGMHSDGTTAAIDPRPFEGIPNAIIALPDGELVAAGYTDTATDRVMTSFARLGSPGLTVQARATKVPGTAEAMALQPDGKIVLAGTTGADLTVVRINS